MTKSSNLSQLDSNMLKENDSDFSLLELAAIVANHIKTIAYTVCILIGLTAVALYLTPNRYTSTASILPTGSTDRLQDLKSLAGLQTSAIGKESSSELFPSVLKSHLIADAVLAENYQFHHRGELVTLTLQEYFGGDNIDRLYLALAGISTFSTDKRTGVIYLEVATKYPAFSQMLLAKYILELEHYNIHNLRSQAREGEEYLARQLCSIKADLSAAEDALEQYQSENHNWATTSNPVIGKELLRLRREVEIKSSMYLFLTQEYERTKFEAQKDVPIIQLLDKPSLPTDKSGPHRLMLLIVAALVSCIAVVFTVVMYELVRQFAAGGGAVHLQRIKSNLRQTFPFFTKILFRGQD